MSKHREKDKIRNTNTNFDRLEVELSGTRVEVRNNDLSKALRKFKRKVQEDGILQLLKERQHYEKPSVKKKKAKAAARARWLKKLAKDDEI